MIDYQQALYSALALSNHISDLELHRAAVDSFLRNNRRRITKAGSYSRDMISIHNSHRVLNEIEILRFSYKDDPTSQTHSLSYVDDYTPSSHHEIGDSFSFSVYVKPYVKKNNEPSYNLCIQKNRPQGANISDFSSACGLSLQAFSLFSLFSFYFIFTFYQRLSIVSCFFIIICIIYSCFFTQAFLHRQSERP